MAMEFLKRVSDWLWGPPLQILLLGTGVYLTFVLGFVQFRHFFSGWKRMLSKSEGEGEITPFQALTTALSATVGTGNIAGVATAIAGGGPGALFWMWVTAVLGMATKYAEAVLAVHYRVKDEEAFHGGPMYYIERGLNWKSGAVAFALFGTVAAFGIGNMVQSNSIAVAMESYAGVPSSVTGVVIMILVGMVIVGGLRRIAQVAERLVPVMAIIYVGGGLAVIVKHLNLLPQVIGEVFSQAFTPEAGKGFIMGIIAREAVRYGVARGLFSNESGLGSAPIAHAASKVKHPAHMGVVAMMGPFIDTILICSITGLVILMTRPSMDALQSSAITAEAFRIGIGAAGKAIVAVGLFLFAYSTVLGWFYYGQQCFIYLVGRKWDLVYRWIFVTLAGIGCVVKVDFVWMISDIMNALMAFPNLVALVGLSLVVRRLSSELAS